MRRYVYLILAGLLILAVPASGQIATVGAGGKPGGGGGGSNCILISGTTTNCLLISGSTTNALLVQ